jgi:RimJ/RimL family protein N-acetyltransferase
VPEDLDDMAALLGDPEVMTYYPAPFDLDRAASWIDRNIERYATDGIGLWRLSTNDGAFVGDCGLTWQEVEGERMLEVGYHVRVAMQRRGYATEAAAACLSYARSLGFAELSAIIHPASVASRRVAEKIGLTFLRATETSVIYRTSITDFSTG